MGRGKTVVRYQSVYGDTPRDDAYFPTQNYLVREILDASSRRTALRRLGVLLDCETTVLLPGLDHLGGTESEIFISLNYLLSKGATVEVALPRLTIHRAGEIAIFCRAIQVARERIVRRKKLVGSLVTSLLRGTNQYVGRPTKVTAELVSEVMAARHAGASYRTISRKTGISRSTVMRILRLRQVS